MAATRVVLAATLALAMPARADDATPFELGVARFQAGELAAAIPLLAQAHVQNPRDADAALLLGIAYYKTGRAGDARPLLEQAERDGDADAQASARVFLGLVADARGDDTRARDYYDLVARSSTDLAASGRLLLDPDAAERWSAIAIVRSGYDSNVPLVSDTAAAPGRGMSGAGTGDADLTAIVAFAGRPIESVPIALDEAASYRKQAELTAYDFFANRAGATLALAGPNDDAQLAYHFETQTLGGQLYQLGHVADASYRHWFGELGARASYTFADRDYMQTDYAGYTGLDHTGVAELAWGPPSARLQLAAGYVFERDATTDATLAETGNGGRATLIARLGDGVELHGALLAIDRVYDSASMGRVDHYVRGDAALSVELTRQLSLVLGGSYLGNASTDASFAYTKLAVFAGVSVGESSR